MSNLRDLPTGICHKDLMLATPGKLFSAPGWIFELKYDGFRVLITKHGDSVRPDSRNGLDKAYLLSRAVDEVRPIPHDFVADGELVILDHKRLPAMGSIAEAARQQEPAKDSPRIDRGSCSDLRVRSTLARRCGLPETDSPRA